MGPYLYCTKCKKYPKKIIQISNNVTEEREWDGDCYELTKTFPLEQEETFFCTCGTKLLEGGVK